MLDELSNQSLPVPKCPSSIPLKPSIQYPVLKLSKQITERACSPYMISPYYVFLDQSESINTSICKYRVASAETTTPISNYPSPVIIPRSDTKNNACRQKHGGYPLSKTPEYLSICHILQLSLVIECPLITPLYPAFLKAELFNVDSATSMETTPHPPSFPQLAHPHNRGSISTRYLP